MAKRRLILTILMTSLVLSMHLVTPAAASPAIYGAFQSVWDRTDKPVANGVVSRTWMWGDSAFSVPMRERYEGASLPDGPSFTDQRVAEYFDESPGIAAYTAWLKPKE